MRASRMAKPEVLRNFAEQNSSCGGEREGEHMKKAFDNEQYIKLQQKHIQERIKMFGGKLYLELGGKLFDDLHASRVLPGFDPSVKIKLLEKMKDKVEIIMCISANHIEKNKIRADLGLSYDDEVLRLIDQFRNLGLFVSSIVITLYKGQSSATKFAQLLKNRGEKVYFHKYTKGYPNDIDVIVSDEGYGANDYIQTTRPLVVVTAPGPSSGKLATCLSQLYHENKRGVKAGYAKYETFPIWNLPLKHPVNVAYEAATADIKDVNMIDPYHFNHYGKLAVNYNRDIEVFPVLKNILKKILKKDIYFSPTDMGVNMAGFAIVDDAAAQEASIREILRRYYAYSCAYKKGQTSYDAVDRMKMLLNELELSPKDLDVAQFAKRFSKESGRPCMVIKLDDGTVVAGKSKDLISAPGAAVLNALKTLAGLDDKPLISDEVLLPILKLKTEVLKSTSSQLSLDDVLIALSIMSVKSQDAKKCLDAIPKLKACEAHSTYILSPADEATIKKLGIYLSSEPEFLDGNLFEN